MIKVAHHPIYAHPLPADHRFPMLKYELIPEQLFHQGIITQDQIITPSFCADDVVCLTHTTEYLHKLHHLQLSDKEQRAIGFPQSEQLIQRELCIMQGTIDCALYAIHNNSCTLNIAGGTHHAFADRGEGFCLLNDMAIATNYLLQQQLAQRILIIDLDVHQGNGTASIFQTSSSVFTFSMHGAHNYPFHKEQSHLDVPLPDGINGQDYLALLEKNLNEIIDAFKPDFAFYLCGVDVLSTDKFGKLNLSLQDCAARDEFVFHTLSKHNIACTCAMGGGYSADVRIIVDAHCNTFKLAAEYY
jgi:acetoin utilization deacetylase AcuC-like enzyme